jgi:uncharacterized radical SAM protein YgiQ
MYLPTTAEEIRALGWDRPDVILVTGDAYIDSPHIGVAVIGKYLLKHGFRTAVIAQPSLEGGSDIGRLGEPRLFWGVTAGCIDSMVANYTPLKKFRNQDDYTPGGVNTRPDRATIAYTNLIRRYFKKTKPIVLGGIEASLRRIAHYDYWSDTVRRSILFDSKADIIAYGMAEVTAVELARALAEGGDWKHIKGICYISPTPVDDYTRLPSFDEVSADKQSFLEMTSLFHGKIDDADTGFVQKHGDRFLIHNPPRPLLTTRELDEICDLEFEYGVHPYYGAGEVRALETIKQSITTHRGCFGGCSFCSIAVHQGRGVVSRSARSIVKEAERIARRPGFNGIIYDVGGPTANMYGATCEKGWRCSRKSCLMPGICPNLKFGHGEQLELLGELMKIPKVKKVFVSSGIRHDMVIADGEHGARYVDGLVKHHISGQIKLAPEHSVDEVLTLMNKPSIDSLIRFKAMFDEASRRAGFRRYLTYYIIAAHPGCTPEHMRALRVFMSAELKLIPEQVQIFTPTPSTLSTAMYHCGTDMSGREIFCEKGLKGMQRQKEVLKKDRRK